MDGQPPHPLIGCFRWHIFIRIVTLMNMTNYGLNSANMLVLLGQYSRLLQQDPNNPGLNDLTLSQLRKKWLSMQPQDLDDQFEHRFSALFP